MTEISMAVIPIGPDRRTVFKNTVVPHAAEARKQHVILSEFTRIAADLQAARELFVTSSTDEKVVLKEWMEELHREQFALGGGPLNVFARETFRLEVNFLRNEYDNWAIENAKLKGEITPLRAIEVTRPQVPPEVRGRREHDSPPRLHHGLGTLPIHRTFEVPVDISTALTAMSSRRWPQDQETQKIAQNVLSLFPENFIRGPRPSAFRRPGDIASAVVDVTAMLIDYSEGRVISPSGRDIGQPSAEQEAKIQAGIHIILLHELYAELTDPAVTERGFLLRVQKNISSTFNQMAEMIDKEGFERIASAIESLPDIEAALIRSRLSISEDIKLGFPRSELAHPKRFAEMLDWAVYSRANRVTIDTDFGKRWVTSSTAIDLVLEKLQEREETGDIDMSAVLIPISTMPHGEDLLEKVFIATHDQGRTLLVQAMEDSGMFEELTRDFSYQLDYGINAHRTSSNDEDLREYVYEHTEVS
ncbi:hypothetical protein A3J13_01125 [Candidatus Daviesbacteria bacterium RIFCSPLOWO2_02_FULL_36_8]|uniref:Uncharacterized protein n=1 Tax=Candidatus Daviesbacteria bacterium RIFCSPLOWO2_02_FULL_36_8 TaxID=1797793 RepID=A0A1F5MFD8_9BACT|nr:MAG: hypothetical protein A3J13_01125 [Candidatus Daviesbacteria bacterium RIFCSPLOWO2_02_FULL_36_8]